MYNLYSEYENWVSLPLCMFACEDVRFAFEMIDWQNCFGSFFSWKHLEEVLNAQGPATLQLGIEPEENLCSDCGE